MMAAAIANSPLAPSADGLRLRVHVTPRAAVDRIGETFDDGRGSRLRISVNAPPHDGKANAAVIRLLARTWRLPKTAFAIVAGASGRDKVVAIRGDADALAAKIDVARGTAAGNRSRGRR